MASKSVIVRRNMFGESCCVECPKLIKQSGGRGRIRMYCSNRCKMRARNRRMAERRYPLRRRNGLRWC